MSLGELAGQSGGSADSFVNSDMGLSPRCGPTSYFVSVSQQSQCKSLSTRGRKSEPSKSKRGLLAGSCDLGMISNSNTIKTGT